MKFNNTVIKKTKIIATAGPSLQSEKDFTALFSLGVNAIRINTSHGTQESYKKIIDTIRKVQKDMNLPISIIIDTKGPEIRTNKFENHEANILKGKLIKIYYDKKVVGNSSAFSVDYSWMGVIAKPEQEILVDDGKLKLKILQVVNSKKYVQAIALNTAKIGENKTFTIKGVNLELPFISEVDKETLLFSIKNNVDYIAASFVSTKNDVNLMKNFLDNNGGNNILIISKIESIQGIKNLNSIISVSDGLMFARGDLGSEIPLYEIPYYQKVLINKSLKKNKFVVVATEMLESMILKSIPTRAEVTDIYYAGILSADSTMLSGETAIGYYPENAVQIMSDTLIQSEKNAKHNLKEAQITKRFEKYNEKFSKAFLDFNDEKTLKYILVFSNDIMFINLLSKTRMNVIFLVLTSKEELVNKFGVEYGIYAQYVNNLKNYDDNELLRKIILESKIKTKNEILVLNEKKYKIIKI